MPKQNRVTPHGEIIATPARGLMFGNRGGRIHDPESKQLNPTRRWVNKQWICCVTEFKSRQRDVMGNSYTELFFLDEVTALAAGHRPCFECRRKDAEDFAERWRVATRKKTRPYVKEMDTILHNERLSGKSKASFETTWDELPDGAMVSQQNTVFAKKNGHALRWSAEGYEKWKNLHFQGPVTCLTPPMIVTILKSGYEPIWHPSADT